MKVAIIGGTGFVGVHLVERLIRDGHRPCLLVRPGSEDKIDQTADCDQVPGDLGDKDALARCISGADAVIYLIGILREFPSRGITFEALQWRGVESVIAAAKAAGVSRFLLMSANGVRLDGTTYQRTKALGEESLKASGLDWTIFRPSVIFGEPRGRMEFCSQLKRDIIASPLPAPLFYPGWLPTAAGSFQLAPVAVTDVAAAFSKALLDPDTRRQTYALCGPDRVSWRTILTTIATASGRKKWMLPAPALVVGALAGLFDSQAWFPVTRDQLTMLLEGNVCDGNDAFARLGLTPTHFDLAALGYLAS